MGLLLDGFAAPRTEADLLHFKNRPWRDTNEQIGHGRGIRVGNMTAALDAAAHASSHQNRRRFLSCTFPLQVALLTLDARADEAGLVPRGTNAFPQRSNNCEAQFPAAPRYPARQVAQNRLRRPSGCPFR